MNKTNSHAENFASEIEGATIETTGNITVVRYATPGGGLFAVIYGLKSVRPKKHYRFSDGYEQRERYIQKYLHEVEARKLEKASYKVQEKEKAKQMLATVKPGDIFVSTWGYEQTNVDFYQVTAVKAASVVVQKIRKSTRPAGFMSELCLPMKDGFVEEPMSRRFSGNGFSINSYSCAFLWDGNEVLSTSYA